MTRRSLLLVAALAGGATVVVNLALALLTRRHDVVVVSLAVLCVVALGWAVVEGSARLSPARWRTDQLVEDRWARREATLGSYQRMLEHHWAARRADTDLQRRLLALAERRLALVHGLTRDLDPEEVRRRLGAELEALEDPGPRRLSPAEVEHIIDRIEEL